MPDGSWPHGPFRDESFGMNPSGMDPSTAVPSRMPDTQWPRYQVFHQERPDRPHTNAGTVHATDAEMALQNARDVFVRRPDCVSLWVVRADQIHSLTIEELDRTGLPPESDEAVASEPYAVFVKRSQLGAHAHAGRVEAASPGQALRKAVDTFGGEDALVWWAAPESLIARTEVGEVGSLFEPAKDKPYRDQAFYHTTTLMRRIRESAKENSVGSAQEDSFGRAQENSFGNAQESSFDNAQESR